MPVSIVKGKKEVDINKVESDLRSILNMPGNYAGTVDYLQKLLEYNQSQMNNIDGRIRQIVFRSSAPVSDMFEYVKELLEADSRFEIKKKWL